VLLGALFRVQQAEKRLLVPGPLLILSGLKCERVCELKLRLERRVARQQALEVYIVLEAGEVDFRYTLGGAGSIALGLLFLLDDCSFVGGVMLFMRLVAGDGAAVGC